MRSFEEVLNECAIDEAFIRLWAKDKGIIVPALADEKLKITHLLYAETDEASTNLAKAFVEDVKLLVWAPEVELPEHTTIQ